MPPPPPLEELHVWRHKASRRLVAFLSGVFQLQFLLDVAAPVSDPNPAGSSSCAALSPAAMMMMMMMMRSWP